MGKPAETGKCRGRAGASPRRRPHLVDGVAADDNEVVTPARKKLAPGLGEGAVRESALFLALDANFRLKRRSVQRSTCVAHDAVDKPDRESLGTASSGIGTVDCARHNMKPPLGVGDLQKGERYLNMDYMFFMSLAGSPLLRLKRMEIFDCDIQFKEGKKYVVFLVPKFHLPAHIELCNILFSFNLTPFVGTTDGEAPERGWADANRLANSTSISGPGARRDTLDAHFQYSNWKKIRMQKYVPMMLETRAAWVDLEASFPEAVVEVWTAMAVAWEADSSKPSPFESTVKHEDLREVRRKLAVIASQDVDHLRLTGVNRQALGRHVKSFGTYETVDQGRRRIERETKLRQKIDAWMAVQQLFVSELGILREREDAERKRAAATQPLPGIRAQGMKLWLPSAIGTKLRKGQTIAALKEMRDDLLLRTHEYRYRDGVRGVRAKTRSGTRTKAIQAWIDSSAEEYRASRTALVKLGGMLKRSEPSTVFGDDERRRGVGKKKKARLDPEEEAERAEAQAQDKMPMSWIWLSEGSTGNQEDVVHSGPLRIEWAKTRAKAMRYAEEVELLEEMRRVLQFLDWRANWWSSLAGYMEGLRACFEKQWKDVPSLLETARKLYASMEADADDAEGEKQAGDEGDTDAPVRSGWLSD
ncbi:hypothetical protein B0H14DRAFT_2614089 [Mycena olivaceomarginata]|nr:hypothetical protein B0H14DRAFT_2614089 [Mycena olivaceomarginata]